VASSLPPFFEGEGAGKIARRSSVPFPGTLASFFLVIHAHSFVGEVGNGVLRASEFPALDLQEVVFIRGTGGYAVCCLVLAFLRISKESFFSGGSAMRCRIPFSSATDKMVPKQNTDPGRRAILHWEVTAIELAWINDTPPTWHASCRCLEPDRTPGLPLAVFLGRTVLLIVTQWFVRDAREMIGDLLQVRVALRCVTPYFLVWIFMW
jgi:hypothetical protein